MDILIVPPYYIGTSDEGTNYFYADTIDYKLGTLLDFWFYFYFSSVFCTLVQLLYPIFPYEAQANLKKYFKSYNLVDKSCNV